ncbi:hypothetical protein [Thermogutta sp.]|uniref:hypothetical protein n=1 Tax=Thermogutta sp. TaxID=1962930 RepID=UPI00321FCBC9
MPVHGQGGAFGGLVVNEAINALAAPTGLAARLPARTVRETHPQFAYVTGLGGLTGNEPADQCGACQRAGGIRSCTAILPFGRKCVASESMDAYTLNRRYNQGEMDITLIGELVSDEVRRAMELRQIDSRTLLETGIALGMYEVGLELTRWLVSKLWVGAPSGTDNEGYAEFVGLDNQIITGRRDALANTLCPDLDSLVYALDSQYDTTDSGGSVLVRAMTRMYSVLTQRAERFGLRPVTWVIVTSPEMRYLLLDMWAAAYTTAIGYKLPTAPSNYIVDLSASSANRDRVMAEGKINILGAPVEVIADEGIPVIEDSGVYYSSIYFVPLTYAGRRPATYLQFFDYTLSEQLPYQFTFTDGGRVQWWVTANGPCFTLSGAIKARVVLEVPHLAGKITGVQFTPDTALPFPSGLGSGSGVGSRIP